VVALKVDWHVEDHLLYLFQVLKFQYPLLAALLKDIERPWKLLERPCEHKFLQSRGREVELTEAFLVKLLNLQALDDVGSPGYRICLIDEVASVEYLMEKIVIREIIKDEEPWSSVVLRIRSSCLQVAASFRHAAQ
jgi:hypothetical protein